MILLKRFEPWVLCIFAQLCAIGTGSKPVFTEDSAVNAPSFALNEGFQAKTYAKERFLSLKDPDTWKRSAYFR